MLKHASNGAGTATPTTTAITPITATARTASPAMAATISIAGSAPNGQLRNSNSAPSSSSSLLSATSSSSTSTSTSTTTTVTMTTTMTTTTTTSTATTASGALVVTARNIHLRPPHPLNVSTSSNNNTLNGGARIPGSAASPLLNISSTITPNGRLHQQHHHHHTYTNQHILAAASKHSNANNNNQTSNHNLLDNHLHQHQQQQNVQQPLHHHTTTTLYANNNNNNNNYSHCSTALPLSLKTKKKHGPGPREALTSLGLLCLVSLLLALLSLIFLLKISPNGRDEYAISRVNIVGAGISGGTLNGVGNTSPEDFVIIYDVTLALCALSLSLNLCCLLVCAIQFLFAVKLVRSPMFDGRDNKYLEKSSVSRTCAVGGFFISIPIFLTGIILYTFNHFHSTPAIITSVLIGFGIIFCGGAMVHNVFVWQKEKTISYRNPPLSQPPPPPSQVMAVHGTASPLAALNMSLLSHGSMTGGAALSPTPQFLKTTQQQQQHHHQVPLPLPAAALQQHPHLPFTISGGGGVGAAGYHHYMQQQQHQHQSASGIATTPVSPNHSHGSFNLALSPAAAFLIRPATATPPTPKSLNGNAINLNLTGLSNATTNLNGTATAATISASGSTSPCLDISNMTGPSLHELSTLV